MNKTVYLCGGIFGLKDYDCKSWREVAKIKLHCNILDPMRNDYRGKEDVSYRIIVEDDKKDIDKSDIILVNAMKASWGTAMEIMYAYMHNKIIISVIDSNISPWLKYHSTFIYKSFDDAIERINSEDIYR